MTARSDVPDPVIQEPSLARRILRARTTSLVAGAAGLVLVGGGASHLLWPPSVVSIREVRPPSVNVTNVAVTANMPDITGLELAAARQAISDAGVTANVSTTQRPAAGPAGVVVAQTPPAGTPATAVTLTLSARTTVPVLAGQSLTAARAALRTLGASVTISRIVSTAAAGTVVATLPRSGAALTASVEIQVADPGLTLTFDQLRSPESPGCNTSSGVTIGGKPQQLALSCSPNTENDAHTDVILGRHAQVFTATLGFTDMSSPGTAHVVILGDDRVLKTYTLTYGKPVDVHVPVTAVLRLRVQVDQIKNPPGGLLPTIAFGDPSVSGDPTELEQARA
jgi:PASTA domain